MANLITNDAAEFDSTIGAVTSAPRSGLAGLFNSIADRLALGRQRQIDGEVGRFLAEHGGHLTDDLERQISRKFGNQAGQW